MRIAAKGAAATSAQASSPTIAPGRSPSTCRLRTHLLYKLASTFAAAVPGGTSFQEATRGPLPATGPYRIVSFTRHSVRLERNRYFRQWSEAAQPAGFPDEIVLKAVPVQTGIALVEEGKADLTSSLALEPFPVAPRFRPQVHPIRSPVSPTWFSTPTGRRSTT